MASSVVKSVATRRFWDLFRNLPEDIKALAVKNYHLWRTNPTHPSLHFRRMQGSDRLSVRIGDHYRALARMQGDTVTWVWIGTHAEYDRLVNGK